MAYLDNVKIDTCYTPTPIGDAIQYDSTYTTLEDLVAVGNGLRWYISEDSYDTLAHSTALSDSTYYYVTQTLNGCESAPLAILFADTTIRDTNVSVHQMMLDNIKIYPNPAQDYIYITKAALDDVQLYATSGQKIKINWSDQNNSINIKNLATGNYILHIRIGHATKQIHFIKE